MTSEAISQHEQYKALINRLFCRKSAPYGGFDMIGGPTIVAADTMVRAQLIRKGDELGRYELQLFDGVEGFAGDLWEYGLHSLMRLDALDHPALPRIENGAFDVSERIAFTLTDYPGEPVNLDETIEWARTNPAAAWEQFSLLIDALSELNGAQVLHRNLTIASLRSYHPDDGDRALRLCGFEMSTLIGDILRRGSYREQRERERLRELYLQPPPNLERARHYLYFAPELHTYLFDSRADGRHEWVTTDVFGLGVLGWELFVGPIPELLPQPYAAMAAATGSDIADALARMHREMRSRLTSQGNLPRALTTLLVSMLDSDPVTRTTSFDAATAIAKNWEMFSERDETTLPAPYLIAFMPDLSVETLYTERHWIAHPPTEAAGRAELATFLGKELAGTELVHCPTGAIGYVPPRYSGDTALEDAQWVLIGAQAVWFCAPLKEWIGEQEIVDDRILVIRFLADRPFARDLIGKRPRRRVSSFELIPFRLRTPIHKDRTGHPSWKSMFDGVTSTKRKHPADFEFVQSLRFLLEYQQTETVARCYAFHRIDSAERGTVVIEFDSARDDLRRHGSPMLTYFAIDHRRRPMFGDFFDQLDPGDKPIVQLEISRSGRRPDFRRATIVVDFVRRRSATEIEVSTLGGDRIPAHGWIRATSDSGTAPQLRRQARALIDLENKTALIRALRNPTSIDFSRGRNYSGPPETLQGNAETVIGKMLALQPFYALQGPPGTGKTMVASEALLRYLTADPGRRVLVTAQANFALDHLGLELIKKLPKHTLVLRWTSDSLDTDPEGAGTDPSAATAGRRRIHEDLVPHVIERLTHRTVADIEREIAARMDGSISAEESWSPEELRLAKQWAQIVRDDRIELSDRIIAGANVVLATCSMAAKLRSDVPSSGEHFDWVIVEEAAKAWPTELIVPLTLGTRWTLIGDHRQLGAHRAHDVENFLDGLSTASDDSPVKAHFQQKAMRLETLNLFRTFFERETEPLSPDQLARRPWDSLTKQFRMHPDIAEPVGRSFYPLTPPQEDADDLPMSFLTTGTKPGWNPSHRITSPTELCERPLVWIDTKGAETHRQIPRWSNPGEVELVAKLVETIRPQSLPAGAEGENSLVVLTPYVSQVLALRRMGELAGRVHTVHSFQGRQADRVVVSLVRTGPARGATVMSNVGHVGQPEVANVLLSRAQRLLVLVGDLEHFAEYGGECWTTIVSTIERYGAVVGIDDLEWL
ncbi:AAA domain-containing protein [Nocardia sp. NPDC058633]|uniref:AAA domain-containing protein n=1 Tax=Nocardia sp. NPDC058633 TaxID=3346568 RepID=UPI0036662CBA